MGRASRPRQMRFVLAGLCCVLTLAPLFAENAQSPVITVRKGTAVVVDIKEAAGAAGAAAGSVLRNDIQLSGALALGDPDSATALITVRATGSSLNGQAIDQTGGVVLKKNYSGDTRRTVHDFIDDLVQTLTDQKGIAGSKIAFVANRTGHKEIYTADYDGANVIQLTHDGAISVSPALSPDARKLAYTGYQSGYADIYLVDLNSGSRNRIIKFPGTNSGAAFSPDGSHIACTLSKDGNPEIYVTGLAGDSPHRLTRTRGVESSPTWSPSGSEIIYSSDERGNPQLYRISAGGGSGRLLPTGFGYNTQLNWSPDGRKVAFNVRSGGGFQVAILDLDSGSTHVAIGEGQSPVWGPNSRHIIFSRGDGLYMFDTVSARET